MFKQATSTTPRLFSASGTSGEPATSQTFAVSGTNGEPVCSLIPGLDGDLQVVHSRSGHILFDVQSIHFDTEGNPVDDHSTIRLTYGAVAELRALLDQIAGPPETRQPALWSEATFTQPIAPPRQRRQRRAAA
jgi:hypothetical protein